jgi:uroporphyrinogen decarboxylase
VLIDDRADVVQLFDSWAGLLEREEYESWAGRHHQHIFEQLQRVPRILFVKECLYLDLMARSGADVISLGRRHPLAAIRQEYPSLVFQGNVDEELLRTGTPEQVAQATRQCVRDGGGHRHIVNLNHGVDRDTPVENFEAYVRAARETDGAAS